MTFSCNDIIFVQIIRFCAKFLYCFNAILVALLLVLNLMIFVLTSGLYTETPCKSLVINDLHLFSFKGFTACLLTDVLGVNLVRLISVLNNHKQPPKVFFKKIYSQKFRNIHRKTPVLESHFKICNFI